MVIYFSGTGNSKLVAKIIARKTDDECIDLFDKLRNQDYSMMHSDRPWVVVVPTYAYQIPHIVEHWLKKTILEGNNKLYFVMTFGSTPAGASEINKIIAEDIGKEYMGTAEIKMPENYMVMFPIPDKEKSIGIIEAAIPAIKHAIFCIKRGLALDEVKQIKISEEHGVAESNAINDKKFLYKKCSSKDIKSASAKRKLMKGWSIAVNKVFFSKIVTDKYFKVNMDKCISCGKCAKVCVNDNIGLFGGEPAWLGNCTHCMACICKCPKEAIEYGHITKNKYRYNCPL